MTQIQEEQALLSCPFCGSDCKLKNWTDIFVKCPNDCTQGTFIHKDTWNTRSLPALIAAAKGMGMVVVPLEPTEEMLDAFDDGAMGDSLNMNTANLAAGYRAMVAASQGRG